jgi:hypothetical protein
MSSNNVTQRTTAWAGRARVNAKPPHRTKLRAREPISRSFGMVRGKFPSQKMGRMIHWESQLERDAVFLFEFSNGVVRYREQPLRTFYTLNGKTRRYTPDFEITLRSSEVILVEIKPSEKLCEQKEKERFERIRAHFSSNGQAFVILTEKEIRQPALLQNLHLLLRNRGMAFTDFEKRQYAEQLSAISTISFAAAVTLFKSSAIVWRLIAAQILFCDLTNLVTDQTVLATATKETINEKLYF